MARLDELDLDSESEEERSVEERVKAQGGSSATPSAAAAKGNGDGDGDGEEGEEGSGKEGGEDGSLADPRRPLGAGDGGDKPKKHRPRFTEDHIIGPNGARARVCACVRERGGEREVACDAAGRMRGRRRMADRLICSHPLSFVHTTTGIERIYEAFPSICRFRGAGHEVGGGRAGRAACNGPTHMGWTDKLITKPYVNFSHTHAKQADDLRRLMRCYKVKTKKKNSDSRLCGRYMHSINSAHTSLTPHRRHRPTDPDRSGPTRSSRSSRSRTCWTACRSSRAARASASAWTS
jgi:hypothetical protein